MDGLDWIGWMDGWTDVYVDIIYIYIHTHANMCDGTNTRMYYMIACNVLCSTLHSPRNTMTGWVAIRSISNYG